MSTARSWPPEQARFSSFTERAKAAPHCLGGEQILASGNNPCPILTLSWKHVEVFHAYVRIHECALTAEIAYVGNRKHTSAWCRRKLEVIHNARVEKIFNWTRSQFFYKFSHIGESAELSLYNILYQQWINQTSICKSRKQPEANLRGAKHSAVFTLHIVVFQINHAGQGFHVKPTQMILNKVTKI